MDAKFKILIGDRNGNVREFLKRELEAEGYQVNLARDGREVLAMANSEDPPNLLIMDLLLPFVDGLLILEKLKECKCRIPVVVYTSLTEYEDNPLVKNADAFIEKEGETERLKAVVAEILNKYHPRTKISALARPKEA
jgi:DNA-binding response OmpR family regulator